MQDLIGGRRTDNDDNDVYHDDNDEDEVENDEEIRDLQEQKGLYI